MKLNTILVVGRLADKVVYTPAQGEASARAWFRLAVNRKRQKDAVDWIPCVCWGKQATAMADYTDKGKELTIQGELHTRKEEIEGVTKPDGSKVFSNYCEINCEFVSFGADSEKQKNAKAAQAAAPQGAPQGMDEETAKAIAMAAVEAYKKQQGTQEAPPQEAQAGSSEDDNPFPEL